MDITLLGFMNRHPSVAIVIAVAAVIIAALGYASVRYVCDTIVKMGGRRRERVVTPVPAESDNQEAPAPVDRKDGDLKAYRIAMKDLGYAKKEYESILKAMSPTLSLDAMIRHTIKEMQRAVA